MEWQRLFVSFWGLNPLYEKKILFFDNFFSFLFGGYKKSIYLCTENNYRRTINTSKQTIITTSNKLLFTT